MKNGFYTFDFNGYTYLVKAETLPAGKEYQYCLSIFDKDMEKEFGNGFLIHWNDEIQFGYPNNSQRARDFMFAIADGLRWFVHDGRNAAHPPENVQDNQ